MKRRRSARLSAVARIFSTASLPLLTIAAAGRQQPFQPAETAAVYRRQQSGCLTNFYSCANQGIRLQRRVLRDRAVLCSRREQPARLLSGQVSVLVVYIRLSL